MTERTCPECDTALVKISENLTQLGYLASDQNWQCPDCHESYPCGEPVGEFGDDCVDDTACELCGTTGYLYQLQERDSSDELNLRFKCPDCYHVWFVQRGFSRKIITVGYAEVMGDATDDNHGY